MSTPKRKAQSLEYYKKNRSKILEQKKAYAKTKINERAECYKENREQILAVNKKWREENKERLAEYREKNKDRRRLSRIEYYEKTKKRRKLNETPESREKKRVYLKEYNLKNSETLKQKAGLYRERNKGRIAKSHLNWQRQNRTKVRRKNRAYYAKRRTPTDGSEKAIAAWDKSWRSKRTAICFWCLSVVPTKGCHADHIVPLSKGGKHRAENLCISCPSCNFKKSALLLSQWNTRIAQPVLF